MILPAYLTQVLIDAPIGLWALNDAIGASVAADINGTISGPRDPGTVPSGVTFGSPGPISGLKAAAFASSTGIAASRPRTLAGGQGWSIEGLINPAGSSPGTIGWAIDFESSSGSRNGFAIFQTTASYGTAGALGVERYINGSATSTIYPAAALPTGTWTHFVALWDGGWIRLYLNGINSNTTSDSTSWAGATNVIARSIGNAFVGSLFGMAVYNYSLSPQQIANHYSAWQQATPEIYLPFLPGAMPWSVPSLIALRAWIDEVYQGGGYGTPPALGTTSIVGVVMGNPITKYWISPSAVNPLA